MLRTRWLPIVLLSSLAASASARSADSLFEAFRARDFARFDLDPKRTTDFAPLLGEAKTASASWPADVGAAYLLEVSAAATQAELFPRLVSTPDAVGRVQSFSGGPLHTPLKDDWRQLFDLSEKAAKQIPASAPAARPWTRAALALLEGANEIAPQAPASDIANIFEEIMKSMSDRLDNATMVMARGSVYEQIVATTLSYDLPTLLGHVLPPSAYGGERSRYPVVQATLDRAFREGTRAFLAGMTFPEVRAEAAVRLGALAVARNAPGDLASAISHFKLAREWNPDPDALYTSWLLEGQAHRLLGEMDPATRAFERAVELSPNGSAARLGLAIQDFLAGDATTADRLSKQILDMPANAIDPWLNLQHGDYRHWPQRVDDLRKAIQ